ncbi:MAG: histidine phosphatase family protein [Caulobacteraceae bacterium]|nr:histidine phosphatase family protein [Caulobacter sp.]
MRQLILLRHGHAEPRAPSGRDLDRALTPEGRRESARAGEALAAAGLRPDRALVSAARRTQETWTAAAQALEGVASDVREDLYEAGADALLEAAQACEDETVLVVAHNPGVGELAARLAGAPAPFPPAAFAAYLWEAGAPRLRLRREPA